MKTVTVVRICLNVSSHSGESFAKICVLVLLAATLSLLLKNFGFRGAGVFMAVAFLALSSRFFEVFSESVSVFNDFSASADISQYVGACVKVVGIGYLCGISGDVCREIGETGAARCISILGKLELISIGIPFIKELFENSVRLLGE